MMNKNVVIIILETKSFIPFSKALQKRGMRAETDGIEKRRKKQNERSTSAHWS